MTAVAAARPSAAPDRGESAEERRPAARQNEAMRARRPHLGLPPALALLLGAAACATSSAIRDGDAAFTRGDYGRAYAIYAEAGDPADDEVLAQRLTRTRWFLIEEAIRSQLAAGDGERALLLVQRFESETPPDRQRELRDLTLRAQQRVAAGHRARGLAAIEEDREQDALRELTLALAWNPDDRQANEAFARLSSRLAWQERAGEELYFQGMDHLRTGLDLRARTSFHHAAGFLGENSRAAVRFTSLTEDLAAASRSEARAYLRAGALGPAFGSLRTAQRLQPEHPEAEELARALDAKVRSERALVGADLAIRGGKPEEAEEYLASIAELGVEAHEATARDLATRNLELRLDQEYKLARAFELDEQVLHAARAYRGIIELAGGFGWNDSELRLVQLEKRAAQAQASFARAMAAEAAGDLAGYRAALEETVRLASDYDDALSRLAAARAAGD